MLWNVADGGKLVKTKLLSFYRDHDKATTQFAALAKEAKQQGPTEIFSGPKVPLLRLRLPIVTAHYPALKMIVQNAVRIQLFDSGN